MAAKVYRVAPESSAMGNKTAEIVAKLPWAACSFGNILTKHKSPAETENGRTESWCVGSREARVPAGPGPHLPPGYAL
jgi:hypothetical protein